MCADVLLIHRLEENGYDVEPRLVYRARFVEDRAVGMRHPVDVFDVGTFCRSGRGFGLKEATARRDNLVALDRELDIVFLDLCVRFRPENVSMDIGKVAHVEEVLDGAWRRDVHTDGGSVEPPAVGLGIFRNEKQFGRRSAERCPDVAVGDLGRQRPRQCAGFKGTAGYQVRARKPHCGVAAAIRRVTDTFFQQHRFLDETRRYLGERCKRVPQVEDDLILAFGGRHLLNPP